MNHDVGSATAEGVALLQHDGTSPRGKLAKVVRWMSSTTGEIPLGVDPRDNDVELSVRSLLLSDSSTSEDNVPSPPSSATNRKRSIFSSLFAASPSSSSSSSYHHRRSGISSDARGTASSASPSRNDATANNAYSSSDHFDAYMVQDDQNRFNERSSSLPLPQQVLEEAETNTNVSADDNEAVACSTTVNQEKENAINKARLLTVVAAALYGTSFSFVKLLGQANVPVGASSMLRFGMAALVTLPWLMPNPKDFFQKTTSLKKKSVWSLPSVAATIAGFEAGTWNSIGFIGQAIGLETTPASESAFICSLVVIVVPLLDMMAGKRLLPRQAIGAVMALVGVAILELGPSADGCHEGEHEEVLHRTFTSGDIASLLQPLAFGMGFWRTERAMHLYPNHAMRASAAQLLAVFLASTLYCYVTDPEVLHLDRLRQWLVDPVILMGLIWTGLITTALTVYLETVALGTLSAAETTLIFSTEPLWGAACAAAIMGEQLGLGAALGAVFIVSGCIFSNLGLEGIRAIFSKKDNSNKKEESLELIPGSSAAGKAKDSVSNGPRSRRG